MVERQCTLLLPSLEDEKGTLSTKDEIRAALESGNADKKVEALRVLIHSDYSNELLMPVLQYCVNDRSHAVWKMLLLYWEQISKVGPDGKLLPELLLVVNALRNKLTHPNEYVRGCTLRFLCKVRDAELLEPLVVPVKKCLQHRYPYVRRNAVLAVYAIATGESGKELFPDAADEMEEFLDKETDAAVRRNAFHMLFRMDQMRAVRYFEKVVGDVEGQGEGFQLVLLDLARRVCRQDAGMKARFIGPIFSLLRSSSSAVVFEAASALTAMSVAPTAVRAAAQAYAGLLSESDNNIKLVCLDRLAALKRDHSRVLREIVMDVLGVLGTPNADVREKALDIAVGLVSPRTIDEVCGVLRKELAASAGQEVVGDAKVEETYRRLLLSAVHFCAAKFPEQSTDLVLNLADFLRGGGGGGGDGKGAVDSASALRVAGLVREMAELQPSMRPALLRKACEALPEAVSGEVARSVLWIVGQFAHTSDEVAEALSAVRSGLGSLPLTEPHRTGGEDDEDGEDRREDFAGSVAGTEDPDGAAASSATAVGGERKKKDASKKGPKVLADGSYATQTADSYSGAGASAASDPSGAPGLRKLLVKGRGDCFLAAALANTLTKLALRVCAVEGPSSGTAKAVVVDALLVMCALLEWGQSPAANAPPPPPPPVAAEAGAATGAEDDADASASTSTSAATSVPRAARMPTMRMDQDTFERIAGCMRVLGDTSAMEKAGPVVLDRSADAFRRELAFERRMQGNVEKAASAVRAAVRAGGGAASAAAASRALEGIASFETAEDGSNPTNTLGDASTSSSRLVSQPDDVLPLRQLRVGSSGAAGSSGSGTMTSAAELALDDEATIQELGSDRVDDFAARLSRIRQLTGFSEAIYAEALVTLREYDIVLEVAVINRTPKTLQNVQVELAALGDIKIVDRPPVLTLAPDGEATVRATIKVSSTETGLIFGQVSYQGGYVNLNEIPLDVMDYIHPSYCEMKDFRRMWAEFEWENKVAVNTDVSGLQDYLAGLVAVTHAHCLGVPPQSDDFLSANLFARSVFGEDALLNVSIEKTANGRLKGSVKIRSKTQSMALAMGDRILAKQKRMEI